MIYTKSIFRDLILYFCTLYVCKHITFLNQGRTAFTQIMSLMTHTSILVQQMRKIYKNMYIKPLLPR